MDELRYAQVIKHREGKDLVIVTKKTIFGDEKTIDDSDITTSHIERENLNLRQEKQKISKKNTSIL